jgi:hypothetical protein
MKRHRAWIAFLVAFGALHDGMRAQSNTRDNVLLTMRPAMLAAGIDELAGRAVRVLQARIVGVFNPRVLVVDTATLLPAVGDRGRLIVMVESRVLKLPPTLVVGSSVTVIGVARTVLGMQVSREVPWPPEITADLLKRLEIRAAVLATSVRTADGVELTSAMTATP